jgi:hypothetical protein
MPVSEAIRIDTQRLARMGRMDPQSLFPVPHRPRPLILKPRRWRRQ